MFNTNREEEASSPLMYRLQYSCCTFLVPYTKRLFKYLLPSPLHMIFHHCFSPKLQIPCHAQSFPHLSITFITCYLYVYSNPNAHPRSNDTQASIVKDWDSRVLLLSQKNFLINHQLKILPGTHSCSSKKRGDHIWRKICDTSRNNERNVWGLQGRGCFRIY